MPRPSAPHTLLWWRPLVWWGRQELLAGVPAFVAATTAFSARLTRLDL
ncbi:hypothetical protein [Micromonospora profundi]